MADKTIHKTIHKTYDLGCDTVCGLIPNGTWVSLYWKNVTCKGCLKRKGYYST